MWAVGVDGLIVVATIALVAMTGTTARERAWALTLLIAGVLLVEGRLDAVRHLARRLARLEPLALGAAAAHLIGRMGDGLDPATVQRELITANVER